MEKREKIKKRIKLLMILFLALIIFFFLLMPLSKKIFSYLTDKTLRVLRPDNIVLSLNDIYSQDLKEQASNYLISYFKSHKIDKLNLIDFENEIKKQFKFIKDVEWDFSCPNVARLRLLGKAPICILNQDTILSEDTNLFSIDNFKDYKMSFSKHFLTEQNKISLDLLDFLKKVPEDFWKNYRVDYKNHNLIKLLPNQKEIPISNFYLFNKKNILETSKLEIANSLFKDLYKQNKLFVSKKYFLDLRFENRIILRKENQINSGRG
jgi:hypothetical protein